MLEVTSLVFGVNAANAYAHQRVFYAALLLYLCVTSVIHHNIKHSENFSHLVKHRAFWVDQFAIWSVSIMSVYYTTQTPMDYTILCTCMLLCMAATAAYLLSHWWKKTENPDCHMALHFIASMTMHCITLGSV